jgi:metal-responsive CopG/Arc/MetJ family transcriptional regulator
MNRVTKVLGFSVPPAMVKEVEALAKQERRTKSELFREMVRVYVRYRALRERDEERWIAKLIEESKAEEARRPMSVKELRAEDERLSRYGARQAKKLGIKPKDVDRLVHDHRRARRA